MVSDSCVVLFNFNVRILYRILNQNIIFSDSAPFQLLHVTHNRWLDIENLAFFKGCAILHSEVSINFIQVLFGVAIVYLPLFIC